ncbi:MAG TPA: hypothetical protein VGK96_24705 [Candidatus Sulfotelmatobacter sp.]|jgi:hypothetical protein
MWSLLQAVGSIVLFILVPVIVVATQIHLVQLVAKLGQVEADQSSFEGRFTRVENGIPEAPQAAGLGSQPAILTPICRAGSQ